MTATIRRTLPDRPLPATRLFPGLLAVLASSACHLFSNPTIQATCEDIPGACSPDSTTFLDSQDSAGPITEQVHWSTSLVVGAYDAERIYVTAMEADGEPITDLYFSRSGGASGDIDLDAGIPDNTIGPVFYDDETSIFYVWDNQNSLFYAASRTDLVSTTVTGTVVDMIFSNGFIYAAAKQDMAFLEIVDDYTVAEQTSLVGYFQNLDSVFNSGDGGIFLLDLGTGSFMPDLLYVDNGGWVTWADDFDDGRNRSKDAFLGPDDAPTVCSNAGGTYLVESLAIGDTIPDAYPSADELEQLLGISVLNDVVDCAWDSSAERYLLFSQTRGMLSLGQDGTVEAILEPSQGKTFFRAAFF